MLHQPIQTYLEDAQNFLIAGAGGGYDVVCGLPLCFALEAMACKVHLASLSFSALKEADNVSWHTDSLVEVTASSSGSSYFPELWLARWFKERLRRDVPIWCFSATGARRYHESYAYLVEHLGIDTVLVVDGGVDTLLRGDEHSLGTPLWDALTIAAVSQLNVPRKILASTAFGAERWDKISHAQVLNRIADLTCAEALLGVTTLLRYTQEGASFIDAAEYILAHQSGQRPSTVICSLFSALRGEFGERAINAYTETTPLWVSPLMCLYWFFDLMEVARQKIYLSRLLDTETLMEAAARLQEFTDEQGSSQWESIPI